MPLCCKIRMTEHLDPHGVGIIGIKRLKLNHASIEILNPIIGTQCCLQQYTMDEHSNHADEEFHSLGLCSAKYKRNRIEHQEHLHPLPLSYHVPIAHGRKRSVYLRLSVTHHILLFINNYEHNSIKT